jgi:hypothetical protein
MNALSSLARYRAAADFVLVWILTLTDGVRIDQKPRSRATDQHQRIVKGPHKRSQRLFVKAEFVQDVG